MVMKPRKYKLSCPYVYIDTTAISYVDTAKYLGVIISHDLSDDTDMKRQLREFIRQSQYHCQEPVPARSPLVTTPVRH